MSDTQHEYIHTRNHWIQTRNHRIHNFLSKPGTQCIQNQSLE